MNGTIEEWVSYFYNDRIIDAYHFNFKALFLGHFNA